MHSKNSYKEGNLTFILYPTEEGTFVAGCEELCLVREGKDAELIKYQILADAKTYVCNVIANRLGEELLNQTLPKEIIDEFNQYRAKKRNEDFQRWVENLEELLQKNHSLC